MHRVNVIGSVNHDRIWQLDDVLLSGRRHHVATRTTHLGGGGFYTGRQLLSLGAEVALVSHLMQDVEGLSTLRLLQDMGFDTATVVLYPGDTLPVEILLEPDGERTLLAFTNNVARSFSVAAPLRGEAAYINASHLEPPLVSQINEVPLVVSQLPLRSATKRPADFVITSRSDAAGSIETVWQQARNIAGPRLKMLVLTDGPRQIILFDGQTSVPIDVASIGQVKNTIGAGDCFGGTFLFALLNGMDVASAASEASQRTAEWLRRRENSS